MDSQADKVNDAIRVLMTKTHVTQNDIATSLGQSKVTVSLRFRGRNRDWTISELGKIITLFGFKNLIDFFTFVDMNNEYKHNLDALIPTTTANKKAA